jgi:hypothetical protein
MIAILGEICIWIIENSNAFAIKVFKMPSKKAAKIMFGRREKQWEQQKVVFEFSD